MKYSIDFVKETLSNHLNITSIEYLGSGNHSDAFLVNKNLVAKFPKNNRANNSLIKEIELLKKLDQKIKIEIPNVIKTGLFNSNHNLYTFFISKKIEGIQLNKTKLNQLPLTKRELISKSIAEFLYGLHHIENLIQIKRKDLVLLHGDFSLNHLYFDTQFNLVGVIDFADSRIGKFMSDFKYLLDDNDEEEFGRDFGLMVLKMYQEMR
ncbi:phosphotransferase [Acholeplasma equirhinis]|uniref:phosphotransferase n=1 Tax=Acholeplasma equirhinis TaxID=555393 RepID=UPI00197AD8FD|nr:phosphotransferase [Acholeplasma equirhinis]MBN3490140.1 phosphotransferase [Acholeplasma equirhinis]